MTDNPDIVVTEAPHLMTDGDTTLIVMSDVMLALLPAALAGIYLFGLNTLYVIMAAVFTAMAVEAVCLKRVGSFQEVLGDGSAAVTGLLLALTLPPQISPGLAAAGAAFGIIIGKLFLGGLGHNIFNPALVGRGILLAIWPAAMTSYTSPVDGTTAATALGGAEFSYFEMFIGNIPGSIGETSALLLLLGAIYLFFRGRIGWRIPLGYLGTVALLSPLFGADVLIQLLGGGLLLGAFYMATDMVTSPMDDRAKLLFGVGCGLFTIIIRELATLPEGVTYAILIMNALVPLMDRYIKRRAFGEVS